HPHLVSSARSQHHLGVAEQRDRATERLVRHDDVPHLCAPADVRRRRATDDSFALPRAPEEVALELDRREALVRLVVEELTGAGGRERVGERDHGGGGEGGSAPGGRPGGGDGGAGLAPWGPAAGGA